MAQDELTVLQLRADTNEANCKMIEMLNEYTALLNERDGMGTKPTAVARAILNEGLTAKIAELKDEAKTQVA